MLEHKIETKQYEVI